MDTRSIAPIAGGTSQSLYPQQSTCSIPASAAAYSFNVTVVPLTGSLGYLTLSPVGQPRPLVSTLNSLDGRIKANAAITPAGENGGVTVFVTDTSDVILDIDGYFTPDAGLQLFTVSPCRIFDSRDTTGPLGGPTLLANQARSIPILSSKCNIPSDAQAYSFNYTVVPHGYLGYLTTWPTGPTRPVVSTLNAPTGATTANAAIVVAGNSGSVDVFVTDDTDLVIDVNGYFAPPGANGLSLYNLNPCRVLDTRTTTGAFDGEFDTDIAGSGCGVPNNGAAFVFNATVIPVATLGYLSLWPDGQTKPLVSTLNSSDGTITSNMAIVPAYNASIDTYSTDLIQLVLDVSSFFAPSGSESVATLSVTVDGSGAGVVNALDNGISCPSLCSASYNLTALVTLKATPSAGSIFRGWSGAGCSGMGNCTLPMGYGANVTATFSPFAMVWNVELASSCTYTTYFRLFDEVNGKMWPDATDVWVVDYVNKVFSESIVCTVGNTICLGASESINDDSPYYWGVGINNKELYSGGSLCQVCGSYIVQTGNLTCN